VDFLCGLPGIGPSAAKRLINEYKTPVAAIQALLAGKKVKGIGDSKLSSIITMLQGSDSK
jgi:DNA uptake protein ComE-like DNA-binding protein